ncbi:MAG: hypothetical protein AAFY17_09140 [Cyanobacteria bacterium J06642_11]
MSLRKSIEHIVKELPSIDRFGVFANAPLDVIQNTVAIGQLNGVQLHGQETPTDCQRIRSVLPEVEIIKAIRVRTLKDLDSLQKYVPYVDTFLLNASQLRVCPVPPSCSGW